MSGIDIDLLHKHALGEVGGRRSGKTFFQCSLVVGEVELGNDVVVVIPTIKHLHHIKDYISTMLREHNVAILGRRSREDLMVLDNEARIIFVSSNDEDRLHGWGEDTIIRKIN